MIEHDHSASRGEMAARKLIIFKHQDRLGNAPAHKLFDLVKITRAGNDDKPARDFSDYIIQIDKVPEGVELIEM